MSLALNFTFKAVTQPMGLSIFRFISVTNSNLVKNISNTIKTWGQRVRLGAQTLLLLPISYTLDQSRDLMFSGPDNNNAFKAIMHLGFFLNSN